MTSARSAKIIPETLSLRSIDISHCNQRGNTERRLMNILAFEDSSSVRVEANQTIADGSYSNSFIVYVGFYVLALSQPLARILCRFEILSKFKNEWILTHYRISKFRVSTCIYFIAARRRVHACTPAFYSRLSSLPLQPRRLSFCASLVSALESTIWILYLTCRPSQDRTPLHFFKFCHHRSTSIYS